MVALVGLVFLGIFVAANAQGLCITHYTASAGSFYEGTPEKQQLDLGELDIKGQIQLHKDLNTIGQPQVTGIKAFVCGHGENSHLRMIYKNGYLYAEKTSYNVADRVTISIQYVELPLPYAPLAEGTILYPEVQ